MRDAIQTMRIQDATFVVVDTETTGRRPAVDRVIEIGAVRIQAGRIVDRFEELVDPGCAIPGRITQLTGISSGMVFGLPAASEVLPRLFDFLGDGVFAAHNLAFDARFLNEECARVELPAFPNPRLCTKRLARRLLPGLRSKGLSSVADFFGIRIRRRHRALPDAEATAEMLLRFFDQIHLEYGLDRLEDLLAFQYRSYSALQRVSRHVARLRDEVLCRLPEKPGVYFMKDSRGRVIYVGKAQNLSSRVRSYFTSVEGHAPRIRQMVRSVRDVEWRVTDSELDALILESTLIKELQPSFNRAHRDYVNRPFIRIDTRHRFPRVTSSAFVFEDGAEYYGPLSGREEASFLVELIDRFFRLRPCEDATLAKGKRCVYASLGRCLAPCEGESVPGAYATELDRVRRFLSGRDEGVIARIEETMSAAACELDFEQAGVYRDWIRRLEHLLTKREAVASRVLHHNAVVIHRALACPTRLIIINRGRHAGTVVVEGLNLELSIMDLENGLARCFDQSAEEPEVYREREVDELFLVAHWLYVHRDEVRNVPWTEGDSVASIVARVRTELRSDAEPARVT